RGPLRRSDRSPRGGRLRALRGVELGASGIRLPTQPGILGAAAISRPRAGSAFVRWTGALAERRERDAILRAARRGITSSRGSGPGLGARSRGRAHHARAQARAWTQAAKPRSPGGEARDELVRLGRWSGSGPPRSARKNSPDRARALARAGDRVRPPG